MIVRPAQYLTGLDVNLKKKAKIFKKRVKKEKKKQFFIGYENLSWFITLERFKRRILYFQVSCVLI